MGNKASKSKDKKDNKTQTSDATTSTLNGKKLQNIGLLYSQPILNKKTNEIIFVKSSMNTSNGYGFIKYGIYNLNKGEMVLTRVRYHNLVIQNITTKNITGLKDEIKIDNEYHEQKQYDTKECNDTTISPFDTEWTYNSHTNTIYLIVNNTEIIGLDLQTNKIKNILQNKMLKNKTDCYSKIVCKHNKLYILGAETIIEIEGIIDYVENDIDSFYRIKWKGMNLNKCQWKHININIQMIEKYNKQINKCDINSDIIKNIRQSDNDNKLLNDLWNILNEINEKKDNKYGIKWQKKGNKFDVIKQDLFVKNVMSRNTFEYDKIEKDNYKSFCDRMNVLGFQIEKNKLFYHPCFNNKSNKLIESIGKNNIFLSDNDDEKHEDYKESDDNIVLLSYHKRTKKFGQYARVIITKQNECDYIYLLGGQAKYGLMRTGNSMNLPNDMICICKCNASEEPKWVHFPVKKTSQTITNKLITYFTHYPIRSMGIINYDNKYLFQFGGVEFRQKEISLTNNIYMLCLCKSEYKIEQNVWYELTVKLAKPNRYYAIYPINNPSKTIHLFSYNGDHYTITINDLLQIIKNGISNGQPWTEQGKTVMPTKSKSIPNLGPKPDSDMDIMLENMGNQYDQYSDIMYDNDIETYEDLLEFDKNMLQKFIKNQDHLIAIMKKAEELKQ